METKVRDFNGRQPETRRNRGFCRQKDCPINLVSTGVVSLEHDLESRKFLSLSFIIKSR